MMKPHSSKPFNIEQVLFLARHSLSLIAGLLGATIPFLLPALLLSAPAKALECGEFAFPKCSESDVQYAGGFEPTIGYGGLEAAHAPRPRHRWYSSTAMAIELSTGLRP